MYKPQLPEEFAYNIKSDVQNMQKAYERIKKRSPGFGDARYNIEGIDSTEIQRDRSKFAKIRFENDNSVDNSVPKGWHLMPKTNGNTRVVINLNVFPRIELNNIDVRQCTAEEVVDTTICHAYRNTRLRDFVVNGYTKAGGDENAQCDGFLLHRFTTNNKKAIVTDYRIVVDAGENRHYWYQLKPFYQKAELFDEMVLWRCVNFHHPHHVTCNSFLLMDVEVLANIDRFAFQPIPVVIGNGSHFEDHCRKPSRFSTADLNGCLPESLYTRDKSLYMSYVHCIMKDLNDQNNVEIEQ